MVILTRVLQLLCSCLVKLELQLTSAIAWSQRNSPEAIRQKQAESEERQLCRNRTSDYLAKIDEMTTYATVCDLLLDAANSLLGGIECEVHGQVCNELRELAFETMDGDLHPEADATISQDILNKIRALQLVLSSDITRVTESAACAA